MTSIAPGTERRKIIVGVDTHKYAHVAVALDELGVRLGEHHAAANREGYARIEAWAASIGRVTVWGVEGTGSYGVGLASYLRRNGHRLIEVNRGDRRSRRTNGKTDTLDAEAVARSVLSGEATAVPKSADGTVEMIRQIKIARDTARKARTAAIVTLKALLVTTPSELREQLEGMTDKVLIDRCAGLRPGAVATPTGSAKHSLRTLARRYQALDAEISSHDAILDELTTAHAPTLRDGFGIGAGAAHRLRRQPRPSPLRSSVREALRRLSDPRRVRDHEPAPALTSRAPRSQRRALPGRARAHAVPPAHHRLRRPPHCRGPLQARHHPLPQAVPRPRGLPTRHDRPPRPNSAHRGRMTTSP